MRGAFALALLAAYAGCTLAQNMVTVPWIERPVTGYAPLNVNCSDTVRFVWGPDVHEVYQMTGPGCNAPKIKEYYEGTNGNVSLAFSYPGPYYFVCKVGDHCTTGKQFVTVNVGQCGAPGVLSWSWRRDGASYAPVTVPCGTNVTFAWTFGRHDVVQVDRPDCNATIIQSHGDPVLGPSNVTVPFTQPGSYHYLCSVPNHCTIGKMLVTVRVVPSPICGTPPPRPRSPPPRSPPPRRSPPYRPPPMRWFPIHGRH